MAYLGNSPQQNIRQRYYYNATAGQTVFSGADLTGINLKYQDGKYLDVYLNGALLQNGEDYTAIDKSSVTLAAPAQLDDIVVIVTYGIFSVADTVSASLGGTFSNTINVSSSLIVIENVNVGKTIVANTISSNVSVTESLGIGISSPTKKLDLVGSAAASIETLADGATITPNLASNNNFQVTISGNRTIANPINPKEGQSGVIYIQQGIGSNTVSWGNVWRFTDNTAPLLSTSNGAVDVVAYAVKNTTSVVASVIYNVG